MSRILEYRKLPPELHIATDEPQQVHIEAEWLAETTEAVLRHLDSTDRHVLSIRLGAVIASMITNRLVRGSTLARTVAEMDSGFRAALKPRGSA